LQMNVQCWNQGVVLNERPFRFKIEVARTNVDGLGIGFMHS